MTHQFKQLQRQQLDATLDKWRAAKLPTRPKVGWVRAIRNALGMSSAVVAQRLKVTDSAVRKFEEAEAADAITLGSLRRVAEALDCELQYALVPRQSLQARLQERALNVAQAQVAQVAHSMALEDQAVDGVSTDSQVQALAQRLMAANRSQLW
jgi:predicted DNA-binding mobile mystery protein A